MSAFTALALCVFNKGLKCFQNIYRFGCVPGLLLIVRSSSTNSTRWHIIKGMIKKSKLFLPAITAGGSLLCLTLCALLTNPLNNVVFIVIFFVSLFVFFVSFGYLISYARRGYVNNKVRYKVFIFSTLVVVTLMFLSAQSLSLVDFLILLLIAFGMLFYGARRTS